jgi:hypothetical protein
VLTLDTRVSVHGEPLLEGDLEQLDIHQVRVTLTHHPDVVGEDHSRYQVDEVVAPQTHHQHGLTHTGQQGEGSEALPTVRPELQDVNHAAAHMAREEEVVGFTIGDRQ